MATIVPMPAPRSRIAQGADHGAGATILFFTGVRYVRDEELPDEEPASEPDPTDLHDGSELVGLSLM